MTEQMFGGFKFKIADAEQAKDFRARGRKIITGEGGFRMVAYQLPNGGDVFISHTLESTPTPSAPFKSQGHGR